MERLKRLLLAMVLAVGAWTSALAWHEYQPMVVEGRRWDCSGDRSLVIEGDTVVEGKTYKKVYRYEYDATTNPPTLLSRRHMYSLREDGKKVYTLEETTFGCEMLLYDFSVGVLDKDFSEWIDFWDGLRYARNTIIEGKERRVLCVYRAWDEIFTIIEGIGCIEQKYIDKCSDGDEVLFDYETSAINQNYPPDFSPVTDGEVNGDGSVDIADINSVINMMLGKPLGERCDDVAADMNLNGEIDIADVNAIINVMLDKQ